MKIRTNEPPREFEAGFEDARVVLQDCAQIELDADEQITLLTSAGGQYDVARKPWGFYATPSINGRLARFGFRTALAKNRQQQLFVLLVEKGQENSFADYLRQQKMTVCAWLDSVESLAQCNQSPTLDSSTH